MMDNVKRFVYSSSDVDFVAKGTGDTNVFYDSDSTMIWKDSPEKKNIDDCFQTEAEMKVLAQDSEIKTLREQLKKAQEINDGLIRDSAKKYEIRVSRKGTVRLPGREVSVTSLTNKEGALTHICALHIEGKDAKADDAALIELSNYLKDQLGTNVAVVGVPGGCEFSVMELRHSWKMD
jgi:hypothetical protein